MEVRKQEDLLRIKEEYLRQQLSYRRSKVQLYHFH